MFPGQCGNTAFFFKSQPDQFHFEFRGIVFPGKSFFSAHEVSTCEISGCLSYRILDSGPDGTQTTLTIVWKQLKSNNANTWFQYGDNTLLEAIMSLTGTVIIGDLVNDPNSTGTGAKTTPLTTLPGNKITLSDLISGGSVEIYSCDSDTTNCLSAGSSNKTVVLKGIKNQITDMLLGTSSTPGVIYKYATNSGTLTDPEKAFVSNLPGGIGTIVRNLSVLSQDGANLFATESSGAIALTMMYSFSEEFFRAARIAMANSKSPYKKEALELLAQSQQQIRAEYTILSSQYGDLASQIEKYNNLLDNIRKQKYMLATLSNPPSTN
ncbi:conjugal transfer protein TraH [Enterobacter roggenkampii]|uniref:conjugal transfer protein TraH n=1 Tax=Enterobacter roggenkampii TaxID=1812935 RepID=UPI003B75C375